MTASPQTRNFTRLGAAVIIAALVIAIVILASSSTIQKTETRTITTTVMLTGTNTGTSLIFNYTSIPPEFTVGAYNITVSQGTGYGFQGNGSAYTYLGFFTQFAVTMGNQTQTVPFFWNTPAGPSDSHPPYNGACVAGSQSTNGCPYSGSAFGGAVTIAWSQQGSTFYVTLTFE